MKKLFRIFSLRGIKKRAYATTTTPVENRKIVAQRLFFLALILFLVIVFRLSWLVAANRVGDTKLSTAAKNNYTYTYQVYPKRGTIYDRTGVPIAVDSSTFTIYVNVNKNYVDNEGKALYAKSSEFPKIIDLLNKELGIDKNLAEQQLTRKKTLQAYFGPQGTNISFEKRDAIEAAASKEKLKGIGFDSTLARSYPNGNFASLFVGMANLKEAGNSNSGLVGVNGVEKAMNSVLEGKPSTQTVEKDAYGRPIPGAIISQTPAKNGQNVYLTLDADLQNYLEQLIDPFYKKSGAQEVTATLLDAKTGDLLATTQRPSFNPQTMTGTKQENFTWNNLTYQLAYEPGSTMKTFLVASAMDVGKWDPNQTFTRKYNLYDTTISDWDINENQQYLRPSVVTAAQGFAYSSNTVMSQIHDKIGAGTWENYQERFGFGPPTRMGVGNEAFGTLPGSNPVTQVMSSFGQGVSVTAMQMLRGWTSFANQGTMLEPHFINKIVNTNTTPNTVLQNQPEIVGKPIKAQTANDITQLMTLVDTDSTFGTANYGMYKDAKGPGPIFTVNGQPVSVKTGTAQIADTKNGGYMQGLNDVLNSAVVMYPSKNPDFIFYLTAKIAPGYELPDTANVADKLIERAEADKVQIDNTRLDLPAGKVKIENYYNKGVGDQEDILRRELIEPVAIGNGGHIKGQSIKAGTKVSANTKILLLTDGKHTMPDMYGWSKAEVEQLAKWYHLKVTYQGEDGGKTKSGKEKALGRVTGQSINDGKIVKDDDKLIVTLGSI